MFIPSILAGFNIEYLKADGEDMFCEDGIREKLAITPFFDIKISPDNQFRIGIPIKKVVQEPENKSYIYLGAFLQYSIQIANLN
jgi:hypothetical protein